jgi:hypothetical protein
LINQGNIFADVNAATLTVNPDVFTNNGTVQAFTGSTLTINATNWSNPGGTLVAINSGVLNLDGTFTNPGAISRDGGTINVTGVWNNTGGSYTLNATTGNFRLNGGRINGGTINQSTDGGLRFSSSGSNILDGVSVNGPLTLSETSSFLRLINGTSFTQADLTGQGSRLVFEGTTGASAPVVATLNGATINLNAISGGFGLSGNVTLTLGSTTTVRGRGILSSDLQFSGTGTLINQGFIDADLSGQTLTVNPDTFTNQGTARATNGATLSFTNGFTQTAGVLEVNASTISADSPLQINGGELRGFGQINSAIQNNATLRPLLGGTGLNVSGNVTLLSASNLVFNIGGLTAGSQYGRLNVTGNVSLGGNLLVSFVNGFVAANNNNFTVLTSTATLTGAFSNVPSGSRLTTTDNSGSFLVNYAGNNIVLSDFMSGGVRPAEVPAVLSETASRTPQVAPADTTTPKALTVTRTVGGMNRQGEREITARDADSPMPAKEAKIDLKSSDQLLQLLAETKPDQPRGRVNVKGTRVRQIANTRPSAGVAARVGGPAASREPTSESKVRAERQPAEDMLPPRPAMSGVASGGRADN